MKKRLNCWVKKLHRVSTVTFQYLRMVGDIDTVMPDKIVKKVVNEILKKASSKPVNNDLEFEENRRSCLNL